MNLAEATALATEQNNILIAEGADIYVKYGVYAYWDYIGVKYYNIVLYPSTHSAKFETANDSQKLAFLRVYLRTISTPVSYEAFVTAFEAQKLLDTELNDYLKP